MKSFPLTELARNPWAVGFEAACAPVALTEHDAPRFVLMAIEDYERLAESPKAPRHPLRFAAAADGDAGLESHILPGRD